MSGAEAPSRGVDTIPVTCHYANDPRRPDCERHAVVAYGPVALCSSCDLRRSTVGKGVAPRRLTPSLRQREALKTVEAAREHLIRAEAELTAAVGLARGRGCSWSELGRALAVSRQAAQQRFGSASKGGDR
ncbi:MAG TPA: hypothetical protein VKJ83_09040 [Actinomycetota bacterium]|nr:hypothetical protein [Actinomycetota bacterium]